MAKYLFQGNYIGDGIKGLLNDGGSKRVEAVRSLLEGVHGKLEAMYFALGDTDVFVIADLPDNTNATALALNVGATGIVRVKTTVLLTPDEVDQASNLPMSYTPPGGG